MTELPRFSNMEPVMLSLNVQADVLRWFGEVILPQSSADGVFEKLLEELEELQDAREMLKSAARRSTSDEVYEEALADVKMEAADVMICFLSWCYAEEIPLRQAVRDKHKINEGRTWGPPDKRGVRRHVG